MSTAQAIRWMQGKDGALNFFPNTAVGIYKEGRRMCVEISRNTIQPNGQPQNFLPEKPLLRTQKDIIAYLSRYRYADLRIQRKCEELSLWRQRALQITPAYSELPGGRTGRDKVQTAVDHICEIEEEINREIDAFVEIREEIQEAIRSVKDPILETLLEYRYMDGLTWEELAEKMHYSYQWVCSLHNKALKRISIPAPKTVDSN